MLTTFFLWLKNAFEHYLFIGLLKPPVFYSLNLFLSFFFILTLFVLVLSALKNFYWKEDAFFQDKSHVHSFFGSKNFFFFKIEIII